MIDAFPDDVMLTLIRSCSTWHDTLPLRGLCRTTREQMIRLEYETAVEYARVHLQDATFWERSLLRSVTQPYGLPTWHREVVRVEYFRRFQTPPMVASDFYRLWSVLDPPPLR